MDAPDVIYLPEEEADRSLRLFEYKPARERKTDIPYNRRETCRWVKEPDGSMRVPAHDEHFVTQLWLGWTHCPYCGGRIEIQRPTTPAPDGTGHPPINAPFGTMPQSDTGGER